MPFDATGDLFSKYFDAVATKGAALLLATLPAYVVLATMWEYYALKPGERSVRRAFGRVFPREDFQCVTFRSDLFCLFAAPLFKRPIVGTLTRLLIAVGAAEVGVTFLNDTFGPPGYLMTWVPAIILLQTLALYLSDEFTVYFIHVLQHKVPILWASHRTHHSAEALTPLTATSRQTILPLPTDYLAILPIDFAIKGVVLGTVLYFSTPTLHQYALAAMGYIMVVVVLNEYFAHGRPRISLGGFNRIWVAPVLHQIHHSAEPQHRDRNFGRSLSVFDWMFGTLYVPAPDETWRLGLDPSELGAANPHARIRDYLFEPWRYAWACLRGRPPGRTAPASTLEAGALGRKHAV